MKIIVINPILYTSETSQIKKVKSIKDSMIYNLCLELKKQGHTPILIAAKDYEPIKQEKYEFEVVFLQTKMKKIFKPNCLPYLKGLYRYLKNIKFDFIITSEVFSINSLIASIKFKEKTIVWHELATHNKIMKKIPSKIWYNVIARLFFCNTRIVARSENARLFISKYCNNVSEEYIDHGVNLNEFKYSKEKDFHFIVVSQLIKRKHIDGIIKAFSNFQNENKKFKLLIIGSGEEEERLKNEVSILGQKDNIIFLGQRTHQEIIPILSKSYALVINTEKDNSMLSIVEAVACATPIITTNVPYNCDYIRKEKLGIITDSVKKEDFCNIKDNLRYYINNELIYRYNVSNEYHVKQFIKEFEERRR